MAQLSELSSQVSTHWRCTSVEYPMLSRLQDPEDIRQFHLRHTLSHLHKQLGKLEDAHEEAEHGDSQMLDDHKRTVDLVGKSFISLLQYASLSGCTTEEIEGWVQKWAEKYR